ncbi:MAG: serine/threonine protein kinase [Deltaproteobacteria bacterium]|nr:serine/threonine protein kinase [Deltaproteobacteria bacterium]
MAHHDEVAATLHALGWKETELGIVGETIARRGTDGSLRPPALEALPRLAVGEGPGSDLVRSGELGRGGMGVVHVAHQRSIGREVAIKSTSTDRGTHARALVREGRIMGALEHPNVVPVHALGVIEDDGTPVLVMKRVIGVSWRALLADAAHPGWRPLVAGHDDRLRANVEILVQLCRALSYAHEHGVVHRDLKPENVMIGRHGEVMLLDWGVALRLAERADEMPGIVGTPGYMPPEMARGAPALVDERTDVYLLGATLFEVLTGRMLHHAETALGALASSLMSETPSLPPEVPVDLADLVRRACALDPLERPASAEAFREALARHLVGHEVDALVQGARAALARAIALLDTEGASSPGAVTPLIEARVSLSTALRVRPGDGPARAELDRAIRVAVEREDDRVFGGEGALDGGINLVGAEHSDLGVGATLGSAEREEGHAGADLVTGLELDALVGLDADAVDERGVLRTEVAEVPIALVGGQFGVAAADGAVAEGEAL